jgi:hypothetical protein
MEPALARAYWLRAGKEFQRPRPRAYDTRPQKMTIRKDSADSLALANRTRYSHGDSTVKAILDSCAYDIAKAAQCAGGKTR